MGDEEHRQHLAAALATEADAHRAALAGDWEAARPAFVRAAEHYRASWESAPPASFGRLVGMLKSAVLAGGGADEARYAIAALGDDGADSPTAAYARAIAALASGDDAEAARWAASMRSGSAPFVRVADAIDALAARDRDAYAVAVQAIVRDFEERDAHLTGVPIADTALMLETFAAARGLAAAPQSPLLPALR